MTRHLDPPQPSRPPQRFRTFFQWVSLGGVVGVSCGVASAAFLWLLEYATDLRTSHAWLVYLLPISGLVVGAIYTKWGDPIRGGANLIVDTIHDDTPQLPLRMAPMVLVGTVVTHLFGGSAGREGTAVQMGASLADAISHRVSARRDLRRQLLAAGIAGGFGSVFGTPIAGALFGLEVVWIGRMEYDALLPALVAALVGDLVTRGLGIVHTAYPHVAPLGLTPLVFAKWMAFGVVVALTSVLFTELTHRMKRQLEQSIPVLPLRMMVGGLVLVAMWKASGTDDYLGLSVPLILRSFVDPNLAPYAFALKLAFTAVTLSVGFLGGEVTPLFCIGATLGAALGRAFGLPLELAAGVGLASLFGAAANTPIALSIMAIELMGENVLPHVAIVLVVAYVVTGHRGIYPAQRIVRHKRHGHLLGPIVALRSFERSKSGRPSEPPTNS